MEGDAREHYQSERFGPSSVAFRQGHHPRSMAADLLNDSYPHPSRPFAAVVAKGNFGWKSDVGGRAHWRSSV